MAVLHGGALSCTRFLSVNEVYIRPGKAVRVLKAFIDRCCRHPSVLNTILPHEVQQPWSAHSPTRLQLPGIHSLFLSLSVFFRSSLKNLFVFTNLFFSFFVLRYRARSRVCVPVRLNVCCVTVCVCKRICKRFGSYNEFGEFEFCLLLVLSLLLLTFIRSDEATNCYKRGMTCIY